MDIKIIVCTHKKYWMPDNDMYIPVQTGAAEADPIGYIGDNTGDNISAMHYKYRELVTMYWGGKNLDCEYYGFVHYRRYFSIKKGKTLEDSILSKEQAEMLLKDTDIIIPKRRNYYIQTIDKHFRQMKFTKETDLPMLRETLGSIDSKYVNAFDVVMNRTWAHMFGMFIMKKTIYDRYGDFYFRVLEGLEKRIDYSVIDANSTRHMIVAYLAEFLMDIYLEANQLQYKEVPILFLEGGHELKKRIKFVIRFFRNKNKQK